MDGERLRAEMQSEAKALADRYDLDFSVESLDRLGQTLDARDTFSLRQAAAYLGEVLVRQQSMIQWCWPPRRLGPRGDEPALRIPGGMYAQPLDRIRRAAAQPHPDDTLRQYARDVLTWAVTPTEETAAALGLTRQMQFSTQYELARRDLQRLRAWWSERRAR